MSDAKEFASDVVKRRLHVWTPGSVKALAQAYLDACVRIGELEAEQYLVVPCPLCGRNRLLYSPPDSYRCEKCGADTELIADAEPVAQFAADSQLAAAEAVVEAARYFAGQPGQRFENDITMNAWLDLRERLSTYDATKEGR